MLKTKVGYSTQKDSFTKGVETAKKAKLGMKPKLGLLYTSCQDDVEEVVKGVRSTMRGVPVVGCTSSGMVMTNDGIIASEDGFAAMMSFDDKNLSVGVACHEAGKNAREIGRKVAREAVLNAGATYSPDYFYMVASPKEEEDYLMGIQDIIGRVPMFGGSAADDTVEGNWKVYCNDKVFSDGVAVVFFYTDNEIATSYTGAYRESDNVGLITVHLYRPFSKKYFLDCLPDTVKNIAVLDRTKEAGSIGEPLYLDVCSILQDKDIKVYGGRYGLSSKNTTPDEIYSVYKMLDENPHHNFTIGINDDVTNLSLKPSHIEIKNEAKEIKIVGFGSDGMVSASKDLLKILHSSKDLYVQGYFEYDSKKSGGVTISHLRYDNKNINKPYYVTEPQIVVVTKDIYFRMFDIINNIKENGILLINTIKNEAELKKLLPSKVKNIIYNKNIKVYYIDAENIAANNKINGKISKIMEVLILNLLNVLNATKILEESIEKTFKTKGEDIVNNNIKAIHESLDNLKELNITENYDETIKIVDNNVINLINERKGNEIPVSMLLDYRYGRFPGATTKDEKRSISNVVPTWLKENCIECGMCVLSCPHAVIRAISNETEIDGIPFIGKDGLMYSIKISEKDCTGCGVCVSVCPGKMGNKALKMVEKQKKVGIDFDKYKIINPLPKTTIKGVALEKPLFAFSGACAGCGETPYIKLLTQIFGEKLVIANATGCSSIYGGSTPSTPYSIPWANSLFEDNAEFALGIHISYEQKRKRIKHIMEGAIESVDNETKELFKNWLENINDFNITNKIKKELSTKLLPNELRDLLDYVPARTVWAIGGDGWAYDIGYGGLDHVLHSNENVKVLVLDTEVYSNTGGQASKSTKKGAVAEFANFGKKTIKKDLFKIASCIPNCYVASISLGANMMQAIKAFNEAEAHNGPAIIIAYSPCIEHGIKTGMSTSSIEEKLAVECGYTILMRHDKETIIDSKEPDFSKYESFLDNEVRFNALKIKDKDLAKELLKFGEKNIELLKPYL